MRVVPTERRECWTRADDETIPMPPEEGASEAEEVEYDVRKEAVFWRLRCACGERRPEWCRYDEPEPKE